MRTEETAQGRVAPKGNLDLSLGERIISEELDLEKN